MQIALLLLSQFFFWTYPIDWQMNQQNVALRGAVVDEGSGNALAGATVYAVSDANVAQTTSNSNGQFIFLTLLPGVYHLCASIRGYAVDCRPATPEPAELFAGFEYGATIVLSRSGY
jgi:hypothetical protein